MSAPQNVIAVIFDFDDTLTDDSTSKLLQKAGIDTKPFWKSVTETMVSQGWDPTLAYLKLMLDHVGDKKPLGNVTNQDLLDFGASLDFYPGIPELFDDLRQIVKEHPISDPTIEFYVISGGLEEIIRGSRIAKDLSGIRGCRFAPNNHGVIQSVMNSVSFTEKTRYIYEINKGILIPGARDARLTPYAVNEHVAVENRRVPFRQMIYIGDGLTDIPCFSLVNAGGGHTFGVFDPAKEDAPRKAWEKLVAPRRTCNLNLPRYDKQSGLGALLRVAVKELCMALDVKTKAAITYDPQGYY